MATNRINKKRDDSEDGMRLASSTSTIDRDGAAVTEEVFVPTLATTGTDAGDIPALPAEDPVETETATTEPRTRRKYTKRARKPKVEAAPIVDPGPSAEEVEALGAAVGEAFGIVGRIAASRRGEHWALTDEEKSRVGKAWAVALAPYMSGAGKWAPFVIAGLATVGVVVPRLEEDGRRYKALVATASDKPEGEGSSILLARTSGGIHAAD